MVLLVSEKTGKLETKPTFSKEKVVFHPLPASLQEKYASEEGNDVSGSYGVEYPTGRSDKRDVPIYISYFIPDKDAKQTK